VISPLTTTSAPCSTNGSWPAQAFGRGDAGARRRRGEIAPVEQPDIVSDLPDRPALLRAVLPTVGPMDDALLAATVEAAMNACE